MWIARAALAAQFLHMGARMGQGSAGRAIVLGLVIVAAMALGGVIASSFGRDEAVESPTTGGSVATVASSGGGAQIAAIENLPELVDRVRPSVVRIGATAGSGLGSQGVGTG